MINTVFYRWEIEAFWFYLQLIEAIHRHSPTYTSTELWDLPSISGVWVCKWGILRFCCCWCRYYLCQGKHHGRSSKTHWQWKHVQHEDVIKWKHFPRNWPFVREIHRSPVNSPHKGQWRGALVFSLICTRINGWGNNGEAGHLIRYRAPYGVTVMSKLATKLEHCAIVPIPIPILVGSLPFSDL